MATNTFSGAASDTALSIGALSRCTGCNIETIRYYERIGVMPEPARTAGGHRQYGQAHVRRLSLSSDMSRVYPAMSAARIAASLRWMRSLAMRPFPPRCVRGLGWASPRSPNVAFGSTADYKHPLILRPHLGVERTYLGHGRIVCL